MKQHMKQITYEPTYKQIHKYTQQQQQQQLIFEYKLVAQRTKNNFVTSLNRTTGLNLFNCHCPLLLGNKE